MAILTIETGIEDPVSISLIISPSDAWEIIEKFKNKYPNSEKSNLTLEQFLKKWTDNKEE